MSKSLGTLTIDLVARVGGFVQGMDKAERSSKKWRRDVEKSMSAAGKAVGAASAIAAGAMAVWIKSSINTAAELENLAKTANASTTEFQKFSAGSRTVGIENEKLSDILKDVTDRVGDFLVTGGGPMADFFEKVAPMVGVTAEHFRDLSGPEALGLYVDTLEKAGASQQEMTFFMEQMASDSAKLIPLLQNGGKEMKGLSDEAAELGLILSEDTIKQSKLFNDNLDVLGQVAGGVGQQIAGELLPDLLDLTDELRDPKTAKAAADMAKSVVGAFTGIMKAGRETVEFMQWAGEELAFQMSGIAALDDVVRMERELGRLESQFGDLENVKFSPDWINSITGVNDDLTEAQNRARLLREEIASFYDSPPVKIEIETVNDTGTGSGLGLNLPSKEEEEKIKAAAKAAEQAAKAAEKVRKDAAKAAQAELESIEKEISALERAAATWGMSAEAVNLYALAADGASEADLLRAETAMKVVGALESQREAIMKQQDLNVEAMSIVGDLQSEEEQIAASYEKRREIILASTIHTEEEKNKAIAALREEHDEEMLELNGSYWEKYLAAAEENLQSFDELSGVMLEGLTGRFGDLFETMVFDADSLGESVSGMAESMARSVVNAIGEMAAQWLAYQAVQMIIGKTSEATAVAGAAVTGASIAAAYAPAAAMASLASFGGNSAPAMAGMTATVGMAEGMALMGMAHDGVDSVPKSGSWFLEKGERVTTSETSAKLDRTLDQVRRDGSGGGTVVNVTNAPPGTRTERSTGADGREVINVILGDLQKDGPISRSIGRGFGLNRRGT